VIEFVPRTEEPKEGWRMIAEQMVTDGICVLLDDHAKARALCQVLRRMGLRPERKKCHCRGWRVCADK
jgi:hypothetical protein